MTATLTPQGVHSPLSSRRVVFHLGRFEALRTLRHPLTWVGAAGSAWMMWVLGGDVAPILERDSVFLAGAMLPLAATTLLSANYATLRQTRLPELLATQPSGTTAPVLGVQLGVVSPVLLAVLLQAVGLAYLLLGDPVGSIAWSELAVGPLLVAVFGMGGVLLARGIRHPIIAPLFLVGLAVLQLLASPDAQIFSSEPTANVEWLAPWMIPSSFAPIEDLAARPSWLHLVYLIGLGLVLGSLAVPPKGRVRTARYFLVGFFAAGVVAGSVTLPSEPGGTFNWPEAAASQTCDTAADIEFCAFGFYADWIPRWQATVAAVDALAPVSIDEVIQRPHNIGWDEDSGLSNGVRALTTLEWDRPRARPNQAFGLALASAQSAVGLPTMPETRALTPEEIDSVIEQNPGYPGDLRAQLESEGPQQQDCSAIGQARIVVALWLAGAALSNGAEVLQQRLDEYPSAVTFIPPEPAHRSGVTIGRSDAELALELLSLPPTEVHDELENRWGEAIDPVTPVVDLAAWFDLSVPDRPEIDFFQEPCH